MLAKDRILLVSPDDVKAESQINYNCDDGVVSQCIKTAQEMYLKEIIGKSLLDRLKLLVYNSINLYDDSIESPENFEYKECLDDYIMPYLTAKANSEICIQISLKIRNVGVSQDSDTNIQAAQLENVKYLRKYYETLVCDKATELSQWLSKSSLEEIKDNPCDCGKNNLVGRRFANTDLFLG